MNISEMFSHRTSVILLGEFQVGFLYVHLNTKLAIKT